MTFTLIGEAASFRLNLKDETHARTARGLVRPAQFRLNPEFREAVDEDIQALAKAGFEKRGYADISDLTGAGYTDEVALHFAERLTVGRRTVGVPARGLPLKGGANFEGDAA